MTVWQALVYFLIWSLVCFFAIAWLKHFKLLVGMYLWEHILLAFCGGCLVGAVWYMTVREFKWYLY